MTAITCINCGIEGVLKVTDLDNNDSLKVFRRIGRNHVSGHLHYQCPVCKIVLLVEPLLIREKTHIFKKESANYPLQPSGSAYSLPGIYLEVSSFAPSTPFPAG